MGIKQFDAIKDYQEQLFTALATEDKEAQKEAWDNFTTGLQNDLEASNKDYLETLNEGIVDEKILVDRGLQRQLTSKERKWFNEAVEKQTIEGLDERFPETIVEDIYKDLTEEHPIISKVDTRTTNATIKYIYGVPKKQKAFWGRIPDDIRQILIGAFKELDLSVSKLSGFIAVPKGYYKLGPNWLANYVMTFLREVMSATLEEAIINGTGDLQPIGMMRKLSGAVDSVYPEKQKQKVTDFTPKTLAGIRAMLAQEKVDNGEVEVLVNPKTYWEKLYPSLAFQTQNGAWITTQLPTGEKISTSQAVPEDTLILGVMKNYLLAMASNIEITSHPDTLAIEDMDLHIAKLFANGVAKDPNAFVVIDVAGVDGAKAIATDPEAEVKKQDTINSKKKTTKPASGGTAES